MEKKKFWRVISREEAQRLLADIPTVGAEGAMVRDALGRVSAVDVLSPVDVPHFTRSSMDGFAVRAQDTYGATESSPAQLKVVGEVMVGTEAKTEISEGEALLISTGAMLPKSADAVVMVEYTTPGSADTVLVTRPVSPGENVSQRGEDLRKGERIVRTGDDIRPQEIGALAAVGITEVPVFRRATVGILSTGDELVPPDAEPLLGQIRGINAYTLSALTIQSGALPLDFGVVGDSHDRIRDSLERAISSADLVMVSGGSSVGSRDLTLKVIASFEGSEILAHGVAIRPGKPTILATVEGKPLVGLPGHPVSAMVAFQILVRPVIRRMMGAAEPDETQRAVRAKLAKNVSSTSGREDYLRVSVRESEGELWADPILGGSSLLSTAVRADGLVRIELGREGLEAGETVDVMPW